MSVEYIGRVWKDESISDRTSLLIMLALADYANDKGASWPGVESVAAKARCSIATVFEKLSALEKAFKVKRRSNAGPHGTNVYEMYPKTPPESRPLQNLDTPLQIGPPDLDTPPPESDPESGYDPSGSVREPSGTERGAFTLKASEAEKKKEGKGIPTLGMVKLQAAKSGVDAREAEKFFCYYEANGWKTKAGAIRNWHAALSGWKLRAEENRWNGNGRGEQRKGELINGKMYYEDLNRTL